MKPDNISRDSFRFDDLTIKDDLSPPATQVDFKNQNMHQYTDGNPKIIDQSSITSYRPKDGAKLKFDPDEHFLRKDGYRYKKSIDFVEIKSPQDTSATYARIVKPKKKPKLVVNTEITCYE